MDFLGTMLRRMGLASLTASSTQVTNATTNVDSLSHTIPANTLEVGSVYRVTALFAFVHTAAATPTITVEWLINGAVILTAVLTPPSTAATFGVRADVLFTVRTVGASGTFISWLEARMSASAADGPHGVAAQDAVTTTVDTTLSRTVLVRARMTTAVASNSLRCNQAFIERVR